MIKHISVGSLAITTINGKQIFAQVDELLEGNSLFYGNTAEFMNVYSIEINYSQELFEKEFLCDFTQR